MLLALMHGSATLEIMIFILIFFEELKSQQEFWKDVTFLVVLIFFFSVLACSFVSLMTKDSLKLNAHKKSLITSNIFLAVTYMEGEFRVVSL